MSGTKLTNWAYLDSDYQDEVTSKNILKKGWYNIEFVDFTANTESEIAAGSSVDIDGVMYLFESQEAITGSESSGSINYIRVFDSGGSAIAEYTTTAPTYDYDKKGWYDATGLKRYVLSFYFNGTDYLSKIIIDDLNLANIKIVGSIATVSSDYTIPSSSNVKVYLVETTDTAKTTITLPDATQSEGIIYKIIKSSNTFAPVVVDTFSTQTINDWNYTIDSVSYQLVPIFFANECCELVSDGSNWKIINNYVPTYDSGVIRQSGTVRYGLPRITLTSITGAFELFEVVQGGTSGQLAIVSDIDAGNGYLWVLQSTPHNKTTGATAPFDSETVTGGTSAAFGTYSTYITNVNFIYPFINQNSYLLDVGYKIKSVKVLKLNFDYGSWSNLKSYDTFLFNSVSVESTGTPEQRGCAFFSIRDTNTYMTCCFVTKDSAFIAATATGSNLTISQAGSDGWFSFIIKG